MFNCCHVIVIALSIYHEVNAEEKLTRQCTASQGRCAQTKYSNCESSFGSGWTEKGSCCRRRPCCVYSRVDLCEDIPPNNLTNGAVTVTERTIGSTANFTCDAGHSLVGNETITCTSSGWNGNIPQCISILCPETIAFFRGSKYIFSCGKRHWSNSETNCIASGGHLASIETAEENTFLLDVFVLMQNILSIPAFFWIGLTDNNDEMSYKWLSGEPLNFSNWYQGPPQQPDNKDYDGQLGAHCVMINTDYSFKWNDEFCSNIPLQSVCEIR
ncbi:type-2 ice-structuring protein-like isoform X2 [Mytilus edulis]